MKNTIQFYNDTAENYFNLTEDREKINLENLYIPFIKNITTKDKKKTILDAGCGSGRDSEYFLLNKFDVSAFDASKELSKRASVKLGKVKKNQSVEVFTFDNFKYNEKFDGIWAMASLLHIPKSQLPKVLKKFKKYLKDGGSLYFSLKEGEGEKEVNGRFFSFYKEDEIREIVSKIKGLNINEFLITEDQKPNTTQVEKWLNFTISHNSDLTLKLNEKKYEENNEISM